MFIEYYVYNCRANNMCISVFNEFYKRDKVHFPTKMDPIRILMLSLETIYIFAKISFNEPFPGSLGSDCE